MNDSGIRNTTPSVADSDGVRVIVQPRPTRRSRLIYPLLVLSVFGTGIACMIWFWPSQQSAAAGLTIDDRGAAPDEVPIPNATRTVVDTSRATQRTPEAPRTPATHEAAEWPSGDPNDIATHILPSDPVPTITELIDALHARGDYTGIGAFSPPGTSPVLQGLAVPRDFVLPPGYVRHHQVTDEGEPLEPILMFSPDFVFRDSSGRAIPIPENRIVPPELAPPGLPIRRSDIPAR